MKLLILCALFCSVAVASPFHTQIHPKDKRSDLINGRIILGEAAKLGQFPWNVAVIGLLDDDAEFLCGGSLISDQWVLTAAHCVDGALFFELGFGSIDVYLPALEVVAYHYEFHPNFDIAVIKMDSPIEFSDTIMPIALPLRGDENLFVDAIARVQGFGIMFEGAATRTLEFVDVRVMSNAQCESYYGSLAEQVLCTEGYIDTRAGTCYGDSGAALAYNYNGTWRQIGIVAFGSTAGCDAEAPDGYARVSSFLDWITEKTGIEIP